MRFLSIIAASTLIFNVVHAIGKPTAADMKTMADRRIANIIDSSTIPSRTVDSWIRSLKSNGTWSAVDYSAGCGSRVSNWPATQHLSRTRSLASAYVLDPTNPALLGKIMKALDFWFANDFVPLDCLDNGGVKGKKCPCGTPGLWNNNWYNQLISVPNAIGEICLLLKNSLTTAQRASCTKMQSRAFARVLRQQDKVQAMSINTLTGANLLGASSVGITLGLLDDKPDTLKSALDAFYSAVFINSITSGDGIQSDGSFMQHNGFLYNGNYGEEYINDLLNVFIETKGTALAPTDTAQKAFETLMSGTEWMMIADAKINALLWQYSVIGRMVSFKYEDRQASGGVSIDFDKINQGTEGWAIEDKMDGITNRLKAPHTPDANQGSLVGTRYFYNGDYIVHRAPTYVTTMKMYSTRTVNSECLNIQNPFGFHLSDGSIFNYLTGDEYVDSFATYNWELIPGITVDIGGTPLQCTTVKQKGIKSFVGGVSDGNTGIAVMDFQNPINKNLSFKKTAFFFPSGYAIQVGPTSSKSTASSQLVTVLDQRKRNGDIYVSGRVKNTDTTYATVATNSMWHDKIGYYFPSTEVLFVESKNKTGQWADIGISTGNVTQQLWTSYIKHPSKSSSGLLTQYVVQPNIDQSAFQNNIDKGTIPISLTFKASSPQVNAAYSKADATIGVAFWTSGTYATPWKSTTITTDKPCVALLRQTGSSSTYRLIIADPSQTLTTIKITVKIGSKSKLSTITLPTGSKKGSSVIKTLTF